MKFGDDTDYFLVKQDNILGMPGSKTLSRRKGKKSKKESIFQNTRSFQEPVFQRTWARNNIINTCDAIKYLPCTLPSDDEKSLPGIRRGIKSFIKSITHISLTISWFRSSNPVMELDHFHQVDFDITHPDLFRDPFEDTIYDIASTRIDKLRYLLKLDRAGEERKDLLRSSVVDDSLWNVREVLAHRYNPATKLMDIKVRLGGETSEVTWIALNSLDVQDPVLIFKYINK